MSNLLPVLALFFGCSLGGCIAFEATSRAVANNCRSDTASLPGVPGKSTRAQGRRMVDPTVGDLREELQRWERELRHIVDAEAFPARVRSSGDWYVSFVAEADARAAKARSELDLRTLADFLYALRMRGTS